MGLLDEFGAWLDNKRRVAGANLRDPEAFMGLLSQNTKDWRRQWDEAGGAAQSVMPGVRQQGEQELGLLSQALADAAGGAGAIKVFHGSPHKFDKFDFSKIGTGEGAQAYGHGGILCGLVRSCKTVRAGPTRCRMRQLTTSTHSCVNTRHKANRAYSLCRINCERSRAT